MTIPDSQLNTWSNQGAIVTAQATHEAVRRAVSSYQFPASVAYDIYLQGSYRNSTNIRGDSDVDLVLELTSTFQSNLTEAEEGTLGISAATYFLSDFRDDVLSALRAYFGAQMIDTSGPKAIRVHSSSGRLNADVVVCQTYRIYSNLQLVAEGISFWTVPGGLRIINFPKQHYSNGTSKNSRQRTDGNYKPTIRMFKNARNRVIQRQGVSASRYPSYFLECLLYNVPDSEFSSDRQDTYASSLVWLGGQAVDGRLEDFDCQNGFIKLFGNRYDQWSSSEALGLISGLLDLWETW